MRARRTTRSASRRTHHARRQREQARCALPTISRLAVSDGRSLPTSHLRPPTSMPLSLRLLASLALLLPLSASAQPSAPDAVIELEPWRTRWVVTATVGGVERKYLFDTGGGISSVSAATAAAAGCRPWGRLTGFNMFGRRGDS